MIAQGTKTLWYLIVLSTLSAAVCGVTITPVIDSVILAPRDRITNLCQLRHVGCLPQASSKNKPETPWQAASDIRVQIGGPKSWSTRLRQETGSLYVTISPQARPPANIRDVLEKESVATHALDIPPVIRVQFVTGLLDAHIPVDYYTGISDDKFDPADHEQGLVSFDLFQDSSANAGHMRSPNDRNDEPDVVRIIPVKKAYPAHQVALHSLCGSFDGTSPTQQQSFACFTFRLRRITEDMTFKILLENESSGRPVQVTYQVYWLNEPFPVLITERAPVAIRQSSNEPTAIVARIPRPQQQDMRNQVPLRTSSMQFPRQYPMPVADEWNGLSDSTRDRLEMLSARIAGATSPDRADSPLNAGSHPHDLHSNGHEEQPRTPILYYDVGKGKAPVHEISGMTNIGETSHSQRRSSGSFSRFDRSMSCTPSNLELATDCLIGSRRVENWAGLSHIGAGHDKEDFPAVRYPAIAAYPLPEIPPQPFVPLTQLYSPQSNIEVSQYSANKEPQNAQTAKDTTAVTAPMSSESEVESPGRGRKLTLRQAFLVKGASDDSF